MKVSVQMPEAATDVSRAGCEGPRGAVAGAVAGCGDAHVSICWFDVEDVPALGYAVLHAVAGKREFHERSAGQRRLTLENAHLRVVVDPKTGCITSLYRQEGGRLRRWPRAACGNELQAFKDTPKDYDAWNIDPGTLDRCADAADRGGLGAAGGDRAAAGDDSGDADWQESKFVQDISLDAGADQAVVANDIDWHETHVLLKAAFPLAASSAKATYEIPYGTIERPTTRNNRWEKAKFEVPALRWADLGDGQHGFSLINDSKYGYDAVGNVLRLTLLRSPTWPDPDADRGQHHFGTRCIRMRATGSRR